MMRNQGLVNIFVISLAVIGTMIAQAKGEKQGSCPPLPPGTFGTCVEACSNDYSCAGNKKCCSNGCGHVCKNPVVTKPGSCPYVPPGTIGTCIEACSNDFSCAGNQKCCSNGCGHICRNPVGY